MMQGKIILSTEMTEHPSVVDSLFFSFEKFQLRLFEKFQIRLFPFLNHIEKLTSAGAQETTHNNSLVKKTEISCLSHVVTRPG